jgi:hypothetical protein
LDYLLTLDNTQYLDPEIQAEIEFGERQSEADPTEILDNLRIFKAQAEEWLDANNEIVSIRTDKVKKTPPEMLELEKVVGCEIKYVQALWRMDFMAAFDQCREVLTSVVSPALKGYRALWNYLAGAAISLAYEHKQTVEDRSQEYYGEAM